MLATEQALINTLSKIESYIKRSYKEFKAQQVSTKVIKEYEPTPEGFIPILVEDQLFGWPKGTSFILLNVVDTDFTLYFSRNRNSVNTAESIILNPEGVGFSQEYYDALRSLEKSINEYINSFNDRVAKEKTTTQQEALLRELQNLGNKGQAASNN